MRTVLSLCLAAVLLCAAPVWAADTADKTPILTGEIWQKSSPEEKRAFFFGVDTVVAIEYSITQKIREKAQSEEDSGKKRERRHRGVISPFERGWHKGLQGVQRKDLIHLVDTWYEKNPDKLDTPVLRVVWNECISPALLKAKQEKAQKGGSK